MHLEFQCVCGTIVQVPERFAGSRVKCPVCNRFMTVSQKKPKPWWEDHQESIKRIIRVPSAQPERSESMGSVPGEVGGELEGLDAGPSDQDRDAERKTAEEVGEEIPDSEERKPWPRWTKALVFILVIGALILLFGPFRLPFVERSEFPEIERAERMKPVHRVVLQQQEPQPEYLSGEVVKPAEDEPGFPASKELAKAKGTEERVVTPEPIKKAEESAIKPPVGEKTYTVNVGSFREESRADRYVKELKESGFEAFVWSIEHAEKGRWYRVSIGRFMTAEEAMESAKDLQTRGLKTFVVALTAHQIPASGSKPKMEESSDSNKEDHPPPPIEDIRHLFRS